MQLLAATAVRIGATRGAPAGILGAAALIDDPGVHDDRPEGVAVLALAEPGEPTLPALVGDSHAYSWDGINLHRRTDPHTMGALLRDNGDIDRPQHMTTGSGPASVPRTRPRSRCRRPSRRARALVSDGLDVVEHDELAALVALYADNPGTLAAAIVAATREIDDYRRRDRRRTRV